MRLCSVHCLHHMSWMIKSIREKIILLSNLNQIVKAWGNHSVILTKHLKIISQLYKRTVGCNAVVPAVCFGIAKVSQNKILCACDHTMCFVMTRNWPLGLVGYLSCRDESPSHWQRSKRCLDTSVWWVSTCVFIYHAELSYDYIHYILNGKALLISSSRWLV